MTQISINLATENDASVRVDIEAGGRRWAHVAGATDATALRRDVDALMSGFEGGRRPLADPVSLVQLGGQLRDVYLKPLYAAGGDEPLAAADGRLLFTSREAGCLNLPWELLPGIDGKFLVGDGRWTIRRTTRAPLPEAADGSIAPPLKMLFSACSPIGQTILDYEKEEEGILRVAGRLGGSVHLDIAEEGTFDELRDLITEHKPHVVHLSGHGIMKDGVGYFAFENERGRGDLRDAREMAERLFAGKGVRLVFISGCQSAQAGVAGVCQALTATGHVPLALGWGASIGDGLATEFARLFFHELAGGRTIDQALATARRELLSKGRVRIQQIDLLDASFSLAQIYVADSGDAFLDRRLPVERIDHEGVRYEDLGDNIRGLREGFVGRRRLLQRIRPALREGEIHVVLLTGIGGAGKSTLATRLANRCKQEGYYIVPVQARRNEAGQFCLRLVSELAVACQRLGREGDERVLRDGQRPLADRLRLAVEVLNEAKILLVLDNLETLMPEPPAAPGWNDSLFAGFFRDLCLHLTREGRAILTCRYRPEGLDPEQPNLAQEAVPDFTEADFFKYLRRDRRVADRMDRGELPRDLLEMFHRKLGATPRFIEQAATVLATIDADDLRDELDGVEEGLLRGTQQKYFGDLFLPRLYDALSPPLRVALSRLGLVELPLPLDGIAAVAGLDADETRSGVGRWLGLGLVQRFGEDDEEPLYAVYPLLRDFLVDPVRLTQENVRDGHQAAAAFLQDCFEKDREEELRLPIQVELSACLYHASEAGDSERQRWAAVRVAWRLRRVSEFRAAIDLLEPLLRKDRHHELLHETASAFGSLGDWQEARRRFGEALALRQVIGDREGEADTWHGLATIDLNEGHYAEAREKFGKSLAIEQARGNREGEAATWHQLATIDLREGRYAEARERFGKSLAIKQAISDRAGEAVTWHQLASIDLREGRYAEAREGFGKSLAIKQAIGDRAGEAVTRHQLASIDMREGHYAEAREKFGRVLSVRQAIGDRAGEAATWHQLATIDMREGHDAEAREKYGKALSMRQAIGDRKGEAATWHQLASIDLREGRYAEAREKFGKSLNMLQAIGDRAGEAASFHQIGLVAWETNCRAAGIRLAALAYGLVAAVGNVEKDLARGYLLRMAAELGLDQAGLDAVVKEAAEHYQRDRGAKLVEQAF